MNKNDLEIGKKLQELHQLLRCRIKEEWDRVLPFNEEIADRWEKARFLNFGKETNVYDSSFVFGDVKVGESTWIGPFTILDGKGGLEIGSYCSISTGVQIYTHDTVRWALSGGEADYEYAPVKIGDRCHIGANVIISKGVIVGNCCVIGACSFVNKSIPDFSIAFGIPCKVVGKVSFGEGGDIQLRYEDA